MSVTFAPHPLPFRFHATLYQCPETANERAEMSVAVSNRINDLMTVLRTTEDHSITQLQEIALELDTWKTKVQYTPKKSSHYSHTVVELRSCYAAATP